MICTHPHCTGVHDNNRYHELCPRSRQLKRDKDTRYIHQFRVYVYRSQRKSLDNFARFYPEEHSFYYDLYCRLDESWRKYRQVNPPRTRCKPVICMYPFKDGVYPLAALAHATRLNGVSETQITFP